MRTSPLRRSSAVVGLAATLLLTAGCAGAADPEEAASTGSSSSSSVGESAETTTAAPASEEPAGATQPFPADASADTAAPVDAAGLTVTAIRAARHDGFDRVVLELSGSGTPGWQVEYVPVPSDPGTGSVVDVPGQAFLQVSLQGTAYPYESGAEEVGRGPVATSDAQTVQGLVYGATFEGTSVTWIGTSGQVPFRVYALTGPSRVVVEVADAG